MPKVTCTFELNLTSIEVEGAEEIQSAVRKAIEAHVAALASPVKKRRGRKPTTAKVTPEEAPKKRGRKPKAKKDEVL